ncbi:MAG: hypothetical protein AB8H80_12005 [Planctomycetota bacterium]
MPTAPRAIAIEVVGDGRSDCVLGLEEHSLATWPADGEHACRRAADAAGWHSVRLSYGGAVAALPDDHLSFGVEQAIVVALTAAQQLRRIVVSSEEGVDVVLLDVVPAVDERTTKGAIPGLSRQGAGTALLLRVDAFAPQLAIVLRDRARGEERSLAFFADR